MNSRKVLVAMSGGVDSSVVALLLKQEGYQVVGVTMCLGIKEGNDEKPRCCGVQAIGDAKKVCQKLKIPHYAMDFSKELKQKVVNNFVSEYLKGRTPNPCIDCNRYIKFGTLLKRAISMGFDFLATGHYARIQKQGLRYILKKGIDIKKDQSYVLYAMTQEQLRHTLMPLGDLTKHRVRQIAREKHLPVADKPESQEICFIPDNNYGEFIKEYTPRQTRPGPIVDKQGKVIGEHRGVIFYTIGQRKGIGIAAREALYVIAINKQRNTIAVGKREDVYGDELVANNLNFINRARLSTPIIIEAKIRYLHQCSPATVIRLSKNRLKMKFDHPRWAITPGQAVVFYNGEKVFGGGTIVSGSNGKFKISKEDTTA